MGKAYRKNDRGNGSKRRERILGKLAKRRKEESSQLRGRNILGKLWCKTHGWQAVAMLSPLACPGCSLEREDPSLLLRPTSEGSNWGVSNINPISGLEEDEWDKGGSS